MNWPRDRRERTSNESVVWQEKKNPVRGQSATFCGLKTPAYALPRWAQMIKRPDAV